MKRSGNRAQATSVTTYDASIGDSSNSDLVAGGSPWKTPLVILACSALGAAVSLLVLGLYHVGPVSGAILERLGACSLEVSGWDAGTRFVHGSKFAAFAVASAFLCALYYVKVVPALWTWWSARCNSRKAVGGGVRLWAAAGSVLYVANGRGRSGAAHNAAQGLLAGALAYACFRFAIWALTILTIGWILAVPYALVTSSATWAFCATSFSTEREPSRVARTAPSPIAPPVAGATRSPIAQSPSAPEASRSIEGAMESAAPANVATVVRSASLSILVRGDRMPTHHPDPVFPALTGTLPADGTIFARLNIGTSGQVSSAEIVSSTMPGALDIATVRSLVQWRFPAAPDASFTDVELSFGRVGAS